jgi:dethiobiotin synthetase
MINHLAIPGLIVTGTDTGVGKTVIAGAIAFWFRQQGLRVAVCKPVATGCVRRREGLVSEDAEFLAHCAEARHPLDLICPQRYVEPLAPGVAAEREKRPVDWEAIDRAIWLMSQGSDVMVIEGVGGVLVPIDPKHMWIDLAACLRRPSVVVARAGLGTINHTLLTLSALRARQIAVAGVVINRYPTDTPPLAEETNPRAIEKWGRVSVLSTVPEAQIPRRIHEMPVAPAIFDAVARVDWMSLARRDYA